MKNKSKVSETTLRRRAAARGLRLTKWSQNSRWYHQYGPFMLTDLEANFIVAKEMDLPDLVATLVEQ